MVARVSTVAFQGIEGVPVEVQVMIAPGKMMIQNICSPEMMDFDVYEILMARMRNRDRVTVGAKQPSRHGANLRNCLKHLGQGATGPAVRPRL
jgi:hypothetical protein